MNETMRCARRATGEESVQTPVVQIEPTSGGGAPPILARIAGLEAEAAAALASPECLDLAAQRQEVLAELARARTALVEQIAARLAGFEPELRRFLLAVKRAAFNGRRLPASTTAAGWDALEHLSPEARRVSRLEARLDGLESAFAELHARELSRERRQVAGRAGDRRFLRGVALGRPGLAEKARAKAPALARHAPGQPAKWERSLLRFVTRAATKLSTNSTLTTCALGVLHPAATPALAFLPRESREISLVRCHRPELEQLVALLTALPAVRERSLAAWNDTVEEPEPGRFLYLREEHWKLDAETGRPVLVPKARAAVRLEGAFPAAVRAALGGGTSSRPPAYGELLAVLAPESPAPQAGREAARSGLDQLIRLGLVLLLPPWPTHEPRLERRLVQFLRGLPADAGVAAILAAAEDLEALERSFAEAERPEAVVRRIGESFARLLATTLEAAGRPPAPAAGEGASGAPEVRLFEEVLAVADGPDAASPALLSVSAGLAGEIFAVAGLVSRFAGVFNHRHELLHTLAAWWRREAAGRTELEFTEVGRRFAPLWKDFQDFRQAAGNDLAATWNPLDCEGCRRLAGQRRQLLEGYQELLAASPGRERLDRGALEALVAAVPAAYAPLLGASAFAQPADAEGRQWVFNNLHEGTGRFLSRLTPVLEGRLESLYLDHLIARSRVRLDGEEAELFEIKYPFGHLVRAHHPQTARALDWRGVNLDLPSERRLRLQDLRVRADLAAETLRLVDRAGRRLLPLHVSTLDEAMLPHLLRILLLFGPGELRNAFPASQVERIGEVVHFRRLSCGPVVLRRAGWAFGLEQLLTGTAGLEGAAAHLAVDGWRRGVRLPRQCFYYETIRHGVAGRNKPQYVDFSSPSLVQLFLESARRLEPPRMMAEEALPAPGDYPPGPDGRPRGLELLFDPLVAAPAGAGR